MEDGSCNPRCQRLQPYVPKAATLCYQVAESLLDLSSSNGSRTNSTVNLSRVSTY